MEVHKHTCLNCNAALSSAYCPDCGQKADTHRITVPHLIKHDLVHGIWHFDKGLLFTLREASLRPGYMAMNYIKGKRIKYYNVFYLILLVLGITAVAAHYLKLHYHIAAAAGTQGLVVDKDQVDVSYYVRNYYKLLLFLVIPLFAVSGFVSFRKLKLNFAEHAVIAAHILLAGAICYFFVIVGMYSARSIDSAVFDDLVWALVVIAWLQPVRVYYQASRREYTTGRFILYALKWYAFLAFQFWLVLLVIAAFTGRTHIKLG